MENIFNYTPHVVNITWPDPETGIEGTLAIQPELTPIRLDEIDVVQPHHKGIPVVTRSYVPNGFGVPPYDSRNTLIVSQMVAAALPERRDLFYPAADIRNDKGQIIGTSKLCQVPLP